MSRILQFCTVIDLLHSSKLISFTLPWKMPGRPLNLSQAGQRVFFRKGEIEFKAGHYHKALMSYRQALLLDPSDDGITAAIAKTNKEIAKDKKDAARKPVIYSCIGLAVGMMVVVADQFLTTKPAIEYTVLQVLLVAGCGGVGFAAAKIHRYMTISHRESMLEEPIDLLKEFDDDTTHNENNDKPMPSSTSPSHKHHNQASGRQRNRKEKS